MHLLSACVVGSPVSNNSNNAVAFADAHERPHGMGAVACQHWQVPVLLRLQQPPPGNDRVGSSKQDKRACYEYDENNCACAAGAYFPLCLSAAAAVSALCHGLQISAHMTVLIPTVLTQPAALVADDSAVLSHAKCCTQACPHDCAVSPAPPLLAVFSGTRRTQSPRRCAA